MTPEKALGILIRKYRKKLSLSQEELGFNCGLDRTFIGMIERGERSPSLNTIMLLTHELDVLPSEIFLELEQKLRLTKNQK